MTALHLPHVLMQQFHTKLYLTMLNALVLLIITTFSSNNISKSRCCIKNRYLWPPHVSMYHFLSSNIFNKVGRCFLKMLPSVFIFMQQHFQEKLLHQNYDNCDCGLWQPHAWCAILYLQYDFQQSSDRLLRQNVDIVVHFHATFPRDVAKWKCRHL